MGTDNLYHRRKANARGHERKRPKRQRYDKVLIVCEGSKTEPYYFEEIKDHYEIDTANIKIDGECGSDPVSVVDHAYQLFQDELRCSEPYDKVFCVFDRDQHPNFDVAVQKLSNIKPAGTFVTVTSIPCFEFWLLLHFSYTSMPFRSAGKKSSGRLVLEELLKYWPEYEKGNKDTFGRLFNQMDTACAFAERLLSESIRSGSTDPLTNVHELVTYLKNIKS